MMMLVFSITFSFAVSYENSSPVDIVERRASAYFSFGGSCSGMDLSNNVVILHFQICTLNFCC